MKTLQSISFKNKKALIRVDFNVPLNSQFEVTDATRIVSAKPTIMKVLEDGHKGYEHCLKSSLVFYRVAFPHNFLKCTFHKLKEILTFEIL